MQAGVWMGHSGTKGRSPGQQPAEPASQADPGAETTCVLGGAGRRLPSAAERADPALALAPQAELLQNVRAPVLCSCLGPHPWQDLTPLVLV